MNNKANRKHQDKVAHRKRQIAAGSTPSRSAYGNRCKAAREARYQQPPEVAKAIAEKLGIGGLQLEGGK